MAAKVLGQAAPAATTETVLYTVPGGKTVVGSSLVVCNRSSITTTFRVSVSVGGGATANKDYLAYDTPITGNGRAWAASVASPSWPASLPPQHRTAPPSNNSPAGEDSLPMPLEGFVAGPPSMLAAGCVLQSNKRSAEQALRRNKLWPIFN